MSEKPKADKLTISLWILASAQGLEQDREKS